MNDNQMTFLMPTLTNHEPKSLSSIIQTDPRFITAAAQHNY